MTLTSVKDIAVYLSVTERTVYRLLKEGTLPGYRIGGQWRFNQEQVEAWMEAHHVPRA